MDAGADEDAAKADVDASFAESVLDATGLSGKGLAAATDAATCGGTISAWEVVASAAAKVTAKFAGGSGDGTTAAVPCNAAGAAGLWCGVTAADGATDAGVAVPEAAGRGCCSCT